MNSYPIWWDTTLTIYNKIVDTETDAITWQRSIVHNCFWKYAGNKVTIGKVILESNSTICRIPKDDRFLERQEWVTTPKDELAGHFTLGVGDIIVRDEVDDEINEYSKGKHSTDLIAKYEDLQGCTVIHKVANNSGIGRCDPHYYVVGD